MANGAGILVAPGSLENTKLRLCCFRPATRWTIAASDARFIIMSEKISIIGDGAMATVCAAILAENGHHVRIWSAFEDAAATLATTRENARFLPGFKLPESVEVTADASEALAGASLAVEAVPVQYIRWWWQKLKDHCPAEMPIVSVAKGIEKGTLLRATQIVRDVLDGSPESSRPVATLSGPCIAPEVARHLPATVTAASADAELSQRVQQLFGRPYFRVYTNTDLVGTEIAAASKNVIAIAAGVLDGLGKGDNAKAALLTRGLVEIARLGAAFEAQTDTFMGLAGMGDLVTTCISPLGRNRSFGEAVGRGMTVEQALAETESVVEGVDSTVSILALAASKGVEMPITEAVHKVLFEGVSPGDAILELMSRPLRSE